MKKLLKIILVFLVVIVGLFFFLSGEKTVLENTPVILETGLNEKGDANDITITPLTVEDSRCPTDVQCVWAGTVKVRALLTSGLGTGEQLFELNVPITTEAEIVTLTSVAPYPRAGETIELDEYIFTFSIEQREIE